MFQLSTITSTGKNISAHLGAFIFSVEMSKTTACLACGNRKAFPYFDVNQNGKAPATVGRDSRLTIDIYG